MASQLPSPSPPGRLFKLRHKSHRLSNPHHLHNSLSFDRKELLLHFDFDHSTRPIGKQLPIAISNRH